MEPWVTELHSPAMGKCGKVNTFEVSILGYGTTKVYWDAATRPALGTVGVIGFNALVRPGLPALMLTADKLLKPPVVENGGLKLAFQVVEGWEALEAALCLEGATA